MKPVKIEDLKQLRERYHLTASQFAQLLGVHLSTLWRWEKDSTGIPIDALQRIDVLARVAKQCPDKIRGIYNILTLTGNTLKAWQELLNLFFKDCQP